MEILSHLHGDGFAAALTSGIYRVIGDQEHLNAINVFPVADGDTGTNLSLSLSSALATLDEPGEKHLGTLLAAVADDLLDGSRGNSGAIVAQFFQGMSDSAEEASRFTTHTFARAVELGSEYAHDALSNPREGTILSVIAAFATSLRSHARDLSDDHFGTLLVKAVDSTRSALARTQEQLEELRKAGVVDAGAKGFVALIEGMTDYIAHGRTATAPDLTRFADEGAMTETAGGETDLTYRYCTECMVNGEDIDRRKLREALSALGNSLVLAGTKRKAKVHIHVNEPEQVFETAAEFGTVSGQKADDMQRQQDSAHDTSTRFAVLTDSAADIPEDELERLDIHVVPLRVQFGDRGYLDKVGISGEEFFQELRENEHHPTTSQPSAGDFRRQYQFLASHFPNVISLSLTGTVSGTLQAARNAADRVNAPGDVHVLDTRNVSLGQGLLTMLAAECAKAGMTVEQALRVLEEAIPHTFSFGVVEDLTFAVRGGRVPHSVKVVADFLRLRPVLHTTPDGRVTSGGALFGRANTAKKFAKFVFKRVTELGNVQVLIGHANNTEGAALLQAELERLLGARLNRCQVTTLGSALGVHAGPGALVVGVQKYTDPTA
ncbi:MAG: DegV family protein [Pseudomonadota bacterium]